jgi:D-serine deaminase-like pyridoxal phosphate-dependent protein
MPSTVASHLSALIGCSVSAIDTPALVVDLDAMQRNLQRMQSFANQHGMRLRPHAKMHKSAAFALRQMQAGAVGVCVQKPSEAAALVAGGVRDVYVSNQVISLSKCDLLAQLNAALAAQNGQKNGQISVAVDSVLGVQRMAQAMATHGAASRIDVYVEIDVGQARCGVPPGDAALALVQALSQHTSLRFAGLQAYHGRAQHLRSAAERRAAIAQVVHDVQRTKAVIEVAGYSVPLVTGAGTGTFSHEAASGVYGELQAGSYLFMDADYAGNEADPQQPQFEHALFVKSQVMSRSKPTHGGAADDRAVLDAGHKSHAIDSGLPKVWAGHHADWVFSNGGDEHGILRGKHLPELGDTVWLVPGHCDPTVNLHSHMFGVRGGLASGVVEDIITVDARGALT